MTKQQTIRKLQTELDELRRNGADADTILQAEERLYRAMPSARPVTFIDTHDGLSRSLRGGRR